MKVAKYLLFLAVCLCASRAFAQTPAGGYSSPATGTNASSSAAPGIAGLTAVPVQSGLMAEYRMLPTETPGALVDYSGNANNATGTVGTSPTIIANTGGIAIGAVGAVSLPSALNTAKTVLVCVGGTYVGNGGAILAGNGAAGNLMLLTPTRLTGANDNVITGYTDTHNLRFLTGRVDTAPFNGIGSYPRAMMPAFSCITWTMNGAAADLVYWNGTATNVYIVQGNATGNGHQTSGNYQLGGIASASCTNWSSNLCNYLNGNIYYAAFWNRVLNSSEVSQASAFATNQLVQRGVNTSPYKPIDVLDGSRLTLAVDGDSYSCGACAAVTPAVTNPYTSYLFGISANWSTTNNALGGRSLSANFVPGGPQAIDTLFYPYTSGNLAICAFCGINDGTLADYQGGILQWSQDRRRVGWKTLIAGVLDGHGDSTKNTYNAWLRQNWKSFADGFVDIAADPSLGADGANANTTDFYTTDNLHIQDNGIINHEAPYINRAISRMYGNHDFSSATVYSSAALAATATTSGTSSATQNVITVGATPTNCAKGDWVLVAGVTPAGYNGSFYLTATTGTTLTMHNPPSQSSLANITVNGTIVCPQQQDADEYQIVNFGAGNYSLQTCVGLTGQNIYIRNINGSSTTLLPWNSETITGAGASPTTLAANTTAILQSQLVSASAAGCNWVRLQ